MQYYFSMQINNYVISMNFSILLFLFDKKSTGTDLIFKQIYFISKKYILLKKQTCASVSPSYPCAAGSPPNGWLLALSSQSIFFFSFGSSWLLTCPHVKLVDPRFITSNYELHEGRIIIRLRNHFLSNLLSMFVFEWNLRLPECDALI